MKLKIKLFVSFLFITLSMLFLSCETDIKEGMQTSQQAVGGKIKHVTIDDVPFLIPSVQKFRAKANVKGVTARVAVSQELDLQNIIEYDDAEGNDSYSIPIIDNSSGGDDYYFENFNIITDGVSYESFILRYNPTDDSQAVDFGNFTGKMEFFSEVNKPVGKITFENSMARMVEPVIPTGGFEGGSGDGCGCDSFIKRLFKSLSDFIDSIGNPFSNINLSSIPSGDPNNTGYVLAITPVDMGSLPSNTGSDYGSGGSYSMKVVPNVPKLFYPVSQGKEALILNQLGFDDSTILPWLQDLINKPFVDQIYFSIYEEDNVENRNFAREMIKSLKTNPNVFTNLAPFLIEKNIDFINLDPCPKGVVEMLKKTTNKDVASILSKLGASSIYTVNMVMAPASTYAETQRISKYNYEIRVDRDRNSSGTKLFKAAALLHEIIHAYFLSIVDDYNNTPTYILPLSFPELFEAYVKKEHPTSTDKQDAQHLAMANKYVDAMASALQEYDANYMVPYQVYQDLAWGSLRDAPIFEKTFPSGSVENIRITNRYKAESSGHAVDQGTPSQQTPVGKPCI